MRARLRWLSLLGMAWVCGSAPANACEPTGPSLRDLLDQRQFEAAERVAKEVAAAAPNSLNAQVDLATVYAHWAQEEAVGIDPAKAARASELFTSIVQRWPDHWPANLCLLDLYQLGGEHERLLAALTRTARHFQRGGADTVDRLLRFGRYHYERREFAQARDVTQALLEVFPNSAPLLSSLAVVMIESEELERSLAMFQRAHELAPRDALVVRNLATDAMYLGRLEDAEAALEKLHRLQPDQTRVLFELAIVVSAREPARAEPAWRRYLKRHETQPDAEDWAAFARSTTAALEKKSFDDHSLFAMAQAIRGAEGSLALALLHGLARRHPKDPSIPFLMAQAYEGVELPRHAYGALLRAEKQLDHPGQFLTIPAYSLRFEAGRVALKLDRYAESIRFLSAVEGEAPQTQDLQYLLGLAHGRAGHRDEALRYYRRCLELPNNAQYASYCQQNLDSSAAASAAPR